ncbi:MAG: helix-turn-helix transcriptional regulator, partial [Oscillibacter sp.]|nr:helix-turn-helix transcriptional regulator [Oscillibacter sp.]
MTLGERLTALRKEKGMSQDALAGILGVSRQSVSKWETDASIPDLDNLVRLS